MIHIGGSFAPTMNFYPWTVDYQTIIEIWIGGFLVIAGLYLWLRTGRDYNDETPDGAEPPVHNYAGIVSEGRNRTPAFLIFWYVFLGVWALGYIFHAMVHGLKY